MDNIELYAGLFQHGISIREIERRYGVNRRLLSVKLKEYGYFVPVSIPEDEIVESYCAGKSASAVARDFGVSPGTVIRILDSSGVVLRRAQTDEQILEEINSDHDFGFITRISKSLKVSRARVSKIAVEAGYDIQHEKYSVPQNLFSKIVSEDSAYWLGFMFADGYVMSNLKDFGITLASTDRDHLEKFAEFVGIPVDVVKDYSSETSYGKSHYSRILLRSPDVVSSLIVHGCVPRKTHVLEPPTDLPAGLTRHFIRGMVDGDGYIGKSKYRSVELVGTKPVLDWVYQESPVDVWHAPQEHKSVYRLRTSGSAAAAKLCGWLYKDSTVFLSRKRDVAMEAAQDVK